MTSLRPALRKQQKAITPAATHTRPTPKITTQAISIEDGTQLPEQEPNEPEKVKVQTLDSP
jgi:hypothetical protein